MSQKSSKILKVYELCQEIIKRKRQFVSSICFPSLKETQFQTNINDLKEYCSCYFLKIAISKFFSQTSKYFGIFIDSTKGSDVFKQIQANIEIIKNKKELSTKHQIIQNQLSGLKIKFESQEAIIYYQINQRVKLKNLMTQKLQIYKQCLQNMKSMKNPHHNYQLVNKLKKNLQAITTQDRKYDIQNQEKSIKVHKNLKDLAKSMEVSIESIQYKSFIFMEKKKLFSQFLQIHQIKNGKQKQALIKNYLVKLISTSQQIIKYLKSYIGFVDNLIKYFQNLKKKLDQENKCNDKSFQEFFQIVTPKNKQIGSFIRMDVPERINNNIKAVLHISQLLRGFPDWLSQTKRYLIQFYSQTIKYHQKYTILHQKYRQVDNFQKILIQHKGNFSNLQKKQEKLNRRSLQTLRKFVRDLHDLVKAIYQENIKTSKLREQLDIHDILNKIFAQYDCQQLNYETQDSECKKKEKIVSSNMNEKINQYQKYISEIQIFDLSLVDWKKGYYSCSLGPRLLIHGYLQNLQEGIYYQSSFNKKNYFFGKTRIFIPKKDIYQINKQIVLLVFSDVLQVKTNKGNIYFHALGKRQKMYDAFIQTYFPQLPQSQQLISGDSPQFDFYEYKGEDTSAKSAYSIKHHPIDYGKSILKNADLRIIFRRYLSDDQFVHQGKHYPNFKHYQLQLINCFDVVTNQTTPKPPYYFMKKGETTNFDSVPDYSVRIATSSKKVPSIPFLAKGGIAFTEQKSKIYWGSPNFLIVDIENTMKGFALTQGMKVKLRCFYEQNSSGQVVCTMSGDVTFDSQGTFNNTIKHIAMGQLETSIKLVNEAMIKFEKNRKIYKNKGIKDGKQVDEQKQQFKDQIEKLKDQNKVLKNRLKYQLFCFILVYFITIFVFKFETNQFLTIFK